MDRDEIIDLAMANMLDIIPLISNIDDEVNADINAALVSIYERSMAMNRDEIIDLAMANMLDIIPLISNIDNEVNADINAALVSIYERSMTMLNLS